jgi:hypothetical protein
MEYFLGSAITLAIMFVVDKQIRLSSQKTNRLNKIRHSQAYVYSLVNPTHMPSLLPPKRLNTQATKNILSKEIRVVFHDSRAYWIANNVLFTADIINGNISKETTKIVDTMTPDKVELNKLMIIVEKLTEGSSNDGRNSGNQKFF